MLTSGLERLSWFAFNVRRIIESALRSTLKPGFHKRKHENAYFTVKTERPRRKHNHEDKDQFFFHFLLLRPVRFHLT